ncbi:hypothetical protein ACOME3_002575 [Neoechinorhynchus agilis]
MESISFSEPIRMGDINAELQDLLERLKNANCTSSREMMLDAVCRMRLLIDEILCAETMNQKTKEGKMDTFSAFQKAVDEYCAAITLCNDQIALEDLLVSTSAKTLRISDNIIGTNDELLSAHYKMDFIEHDLERAIEQAADSEKTDVSSVVLTAKRFGLCQSAIGSLVSSHDTDTKGIYPSSSDIEGFTSFYDADAYLRYDEKSSVTRITSVRSKDDGEFENQSLVDTNQLIDKTQGDQCSSSGTESLDDHLKEYL